MEVTIRRANADDYNVLCALYDEVDALHGASLPHIFQKPNGPVRAQDYYLELIADEHVGLFVAEIDERVAGFVHAVVRDAPSNPVFVPRRYAIVDGIGVASEFRNHGIGRRLMEAAHKWAMGEGATTIELNVYAFNETAIDFYERLGYETLSRKMSKVLYNSRRHRIANSDNSFLTI